MTGLLRVRNEARWIHRSITSLFPLCSRVLVLDDHSTDDTTEICASIPNVEVFRSQFEGLDEVRDKNWLLEKAQGSAAYIMIDGDEMLAPGAAEIIDREVLYNDCLSLRVLYLWDSEQQIRTDGVYGYFRRPSVFGATPHRFESTRFGGNFHCSNAPRALHRGCFQSSAALLHFGYLLREDRVRKYHWYRANDPNNVSEDGYRHVCQGDLAEIPAGARLMHAGPLKLEAL